MKKTKCVLAILVIVAFFVFAVCSGESSTTDQCIGSANSENKVNYELGDYSVVIDSCRLAKDYAGKPVVIVKYVFTNVANENPTAFFVAFDDAVYQNGVGLNHAYVLEDSANYSEDNQTKQIKKGASIDVEVAYELNDTTTEIEVEVEELFSFNSDKLIKKFSIPSK